MSLSVISAPDLQYPPSDDDFSPSERYPEYPFDHLASSPNAIYPKVREVFRQLGLDRENYDTPSWNPLGAYINPGQSVFVLCNFVYHRRPGESAEGFYSKCTHGSVLRAVLDFVHLAAGPTGSIRFGNAPLQSCNWKQVLSDSLADRVVDFYQRQGRPVLPTDLRLHIAERDRLGRVVSVEQKDDPGLAVEIDLARNSLLDGLSSNGEALTDPKFRISDYNPDRIAAFHAEGSHRYVIAEAVLASDVILCLPKLKTHEKVGVTCALKGYVGTVGHKDCLAHHRFGGPRRGGDEFPRGGLLLTPFAYFHDWLNRRAFGSTFQGALQFAERAMRKIARISGFIMAGAWHGNDTAWRMSLDLARIAHFADHSGTIHETPQRKNLVFLDGIIAGEGDGPLNPTPVNAGVLLFSDDVAAGDRAACHLMGFDPAKIKLVDEAQRYLPRRDQDSPVIHNGAAVAENEIKTALPRPFVPPKGWLGYVGGSRS